MQERGQQSCRRCQTLQEKGLCSLPIIRGVASAAHLHICTRFSPSSVLRYNNITWWSEDEKVEALGDSNSPRNTREIMASRV
uniref:Mlo7 n=1 Tax=Arundo donax TaxID=35708 RepID=A0A0A9DVN3_ARUDO